MEKVDTEVNFCRNSLSIHYSVFVDLVKSYNTKGLTPNP